MATTTEALFKKGPDTVEIGEIVIVHSLLQIEYDDLTQVEFDEWRQVTCEPIQVKGEIKYPMDLTIEEYLIWAYKIEILQEDLTIDIQFEDLGVTNVLFEVTQ